PGFDARVVRAETPEVYLRLRAAAPHLVGAAAVVRTGDRHEPRVIGPSRVIHFGVLEARSLIQGDVPPAVRRAINDRHVAVRPVEVPEQPHARVPERRPAPFPERPE